MITDETEEGFQVAKKTKMFIYKYILTRYKFIQNRYTK
jgi:hypothetical protein